MVMLNDLDRFHLVIDVIDRVPGLAERAAHLRQRDGGAPARRPRVHARARRRRPGDPGLGLAVLNVLVVNAGSTSLKLALVEGETATPVDDFVAADAVGHRIVHFGERGDRRGRRRRPGPRPHRGGRRGRAAPQPARARRARRAPARRFPMCRTSPSPTPPSTGRSRRRRAATRSPPSWARSRGSASTGSPCSRSSSASTRPGSSSAISAAAAPSPPSGTGAPSTRRWATRRSRARRWAPAPARSIRARCSTCSAPGTSVDELDRVAQRGVGPAGARRPRRPVRVLPLHVPPREGGRRDGRRARRSRRARLQRRHRREPRRRPGSGRRPAAPPR